MEKYIPKSANGCPVKFMAVSAHKDDTELMAFDGIVRGFGGVSSCGASNLASGRASGFSCDARGLVGDATDMGGIIGLGCDARGLAGDATDMGGIIGLDCDARGLAGGVSSVFGETYGNFGEGGAFAAVVLTDGGACPRAEGYKNLSDEDMAELRTSEQKRAAEIGQYAALYLFEKSSDAVKKLENEIILGLKQIFEELPRLEILYLHNPFDSHPTHVAAFKCAIEAVRMLNNDKIPQKIYGCEGWRDLDWLSGSDKVALDVSGFNALSKDLMNCFESQNAVKRYDIASIARRSANATYFASHNGDTANALMYALDLSALADKKVSILEFCEGKIENFKKSVFENL